MDLDALGLNSTFESTELDGKHEPPVDRVETSDIEGPEDFTMNMTYWMNADLPLAQIKSRKEANQTRHALRMDAVQQESEQNDTTEEGDRPITTVDGHEYSTPASERSMENDEKVRSFLSALPDTNMEDALTGTPAHPPQRSFLQVPMSSPPKARSLQPTVEDYDTPRKPTQETVIHHISPAMRHNEKDDRIAELLARLEQQDLASQKRITELETILSYTRSELDSARTDNYRHKEKLSSLEESIERQKSMDGEARRSVELQLKEREEALTTKMQEFGEEMRLQNLAKMQNQREDFDRQLKVAKETKALVEEDAESKAQALVQVKAELDEIRKTRAAELESKPVVQPDGERSRQEFSEFEATLNEQLSLFKKRADSLQAELQEAVAEARSARENAEEKDRLHNVVESKCRSQMSRVVELENQLQTTRFELECATADAAAKQQLFQTNIDLNSKLRNLQSQIQAIETKHSINDSQQSLVAELELRVKTVLSQLESAKGDLAGKDQELLHHITSQDESDQLLNISKGRVEGLEATIATLRQQLAEVHRESARVRANTERLEQDLDDTKDQLNDTRAEMDRRVVEAEKRLSKMKDLKTEAENKFKELQAQRNDLIEGHEAMIENVQDKAEEAIRKVGALLEQERSEKKRVVKNLKNAKDELEDLRAVHARQQASEESEEEDLSDEDTTSRSTKSKEMEAKNSEITSLREIIRQQVTETKTLKNEMLLLKKENKKLKSRLETSSDLQVTVSGLETQLAQLRTTNESLQSQIDAQEEDFEAVNAAMDEKLAAMVSKVMKERARTVVGRRDGQWAETVGKVQTDKELLGKVLLRQWGREEIGIADEKRGEKQPYGYKYVKRT